jgi:hypothetical protein
MDQWKVLRKVFRLELLATHKTLAALSHFCAASTQSLLRVRISMLMVVRIRD